MEGILRIIHVILVVLWIGGVSFVTIIIFPMLMRMEDSFEKVRFFQAVENRFAKLARLYVVLTGLTGAIILTLQERWSVIFKSFGITMMLVAWLLYALILIFEKNLFKVIFRDPLSMDTKKVFSRLNIFHWFILILSFLAIGAGVYEGHGGF